MGVYKAATHGLFSSLQGGLFAGGNTAENREEAHAALQALVPVIAQTREHIVTLQETIGQVPPLTSKFKKARRQAAMVLGELIAELLVSENEGVELADRLAAEN